ncbi:hypothetical protein C7H19_01530 [Aphanothece hegewaldii CCALA 016]|uniref:Sulfotransferase family protein n=1 Tax=Aphanothece hegewaldii CCALA 016 TaxID=2107694 RepID=A0A2T1M3V6_9CHRO|nr:sulfotransferase family 2 domain-containing protein [Aphanothece hegewaldii]PSF39496.1 hypothetical protein C7H19_01530 [Aphanothece hegewaldii CCALA 016]
MIISHKYKFIFIHIHKCAGTSVTQALDPHLGENDIVLGGTKEGEKLSEEYLKTKGLFKHSKASDAKIILGDEIWNNYFKFAIIRNPWDRLVSKYHWWLTTSWDDQWQTGTKIRGLNNFSEYIFSDLDSDKKESLLDFVMDDNQKIIVDYLGKFERIHRDFAYICGRIGLPNIELPHTNRSKHNEYLEYYQDPELIQLVNQWFDLEINNFQYDLNSLKKEMDFAKQTVNIV